MPGAQTCDNHVVDLRPAAVIAESHLAPLTAVPLWSEDRVPVARVCNTPSSQFQVIRLRLRVRQDCHRLEVPHSWRNKVEANREAVSERRRVWEMLVVLTPARL